MRNPTCARCGAHKPRPRAKYCSPACVTEALNENADSLASPVRLALRAASTDAEVIDAIRRFTTTTERGCWRWDGPSFRGYARTSLFRGEQHVHRIVMAAALGAPLGKQTIHHTCANRRCVNPAHLQQATTRDNVCEMLARNDYIRRIELLEDALRLTQPDHPLLTEAPLGGVASH